MTLRYMALSLISLTLLMAGFLALAAPAPFQGPLLVPAEAPLAWPTAIAGLAMLHQPIFLADLVGLLLLGLAVLEIWVVAVTWEAKRRRR
jgi:hypothetical protein